MLPFSKNRMCNLILETCYVKQGECCPFFCKSFGGAMWLSLWFIFWGVRFDFCDWKTGCISCGAEQKTWIQVKVILHPKFFYEKNGGIAPSFPLLLFGARNGKLFPVLHSRLEEANCAPEKKGRQHCPMYWTDEVKESKSKCFLEKRAAFTPTPVWTTKQWRSHIASPMEQKWAAIPPVLHSKLQESNCTPKCFEKGQHFPLLGTKRKWIVMKVTLHPQHFWAKRAAFPPVSHSAGFKSQIARPIFCEKNWAAVPPALNNEKWIRRKVTLHHQTFRSKLGNFSPCFTEQVSRIKLYTLFVKKGQHFHLFGTKKKWVRVRVTLHSQNVWINMGTISSSGSSNLLCKTGGNAAHFLKNLGTQCDFHSYSYLLFGTGGNASLCSKYFWVCDLILQKR